MRVPVSVCVPGYGHYWLWVATYETRQALKAAAEKHCGFHLDDMIVEGDEGDGLIEGCFSDNNLRGPYLGIMRLYDVSMQSIIHESVHAACCLARKEHGHSRTLSSAKEEAIAYGTEAIAVAVADALMGEVP